MRENRKIYKNSLEKSVRREYAEYMALPTYLSSWDTGKDGTGEYVRLETPVHNGYDLLLFVELKDTDRRKKPLEECYGKLYSPVHSSGKEFRKCDCKHLRYRARFDKEYKSCFTDNKLDFEKASRFIRDVLYEEDFEKLSDDAKSYFRKIPNGVCRGKQTYKYEFHDEDCIKIHFEVHPHYDTYRFIPNSENLSRADYLSKRIWDTKLWATEVSDGITDPWKAYCKKDKNRRQKLDERLEVRKMMYDAEVLETEKK